MGTGRDGGSRRAVARAAAPGAAAIALLWRPVLVAARRQAGLHHAGRQARLPSRRVVEHHQLLARVREEGAARGLANTATRWIAWPEQLRLPVNRGAQCHPRRLDGTTPATGLTLPISRGHGRGVDHGEGPRGTTHPARPGADVRNYPREALLSPWREPRIAGSAALRLRGGAPF